MENETEKYRRARKRAKELKGFYSHLATFVVINIFMIAVNLLTNPNELWFYWPLFGWGFGLFWHFCGVFVFNQFGKDWEERKIKELMEKE
ncbi:MAG: hypothetical protein POELPBGB_01565 [Bacteroidia bacterium]|nr:hypothetical protein [Bacteroidia bacterium]